ncbi:MAG: Sec-independent protein translocase subunit TatA [Actinomycetales bacterium]|nr:Sec-independent protein translocase subunit TatA [Actinomycetales bacterium]
MGNLRGWEWLILLLIVLLLFGARKLPDLARGVGKSLKIFKSEVKDLKDDDAPAAATSTPDTPDAAEQSTPDTATDGEPKQP